jgi:hypothetical protein
MRIERDYMPTLIRLLTEIAILERLLMLPAITQAA